MIAWFRLTLGQAHVRRREAIVPRFSRFAPGGAEAVLEPGGQCADASQGVLYRANGAKLSDGVKLDRPSKAKGDAAITEAAKLFAKPKA